ncbi:LysM peptidoglycan-binding domain-containing protein [Chelativorans sp.]|uniref:LysM peptidoglycan-binding domain-containing protein n=1 Tax=Chelativorans sp. TaxID=2203393 RepID=UPI0028127812|nr:LysM peptidoglycan-binding domain-containing protein [Chelativorans sp.]
MSNTALRILLFVAAILIGGAGTAYLTGMFDTGSGQSPDRVARVQDAPTQKPEARAPAGTQEARQESPAGQGAGNAGEPAAAAARQEVVVPSFDLLRAEPDGSLVVAGRAAPGAEVEVLNGSSVLARTIAGPTGDFVAVLDEPLKPGEHNIVLRATSGENMAATSLETAIVSVPSDESGQLVALVQQPGEPSRLISAPPPQASAPGAAKEPQQQARADAAPAESPESAPTDAPPQPAGEAAMAEAPAAPEHAAPAGEPTGDGGASAVAEAQPQDAPAEPGRPAEAGDQVASTEPPSSQQAAIEQAPTAEPSPHAPVGEALPAPAKDAPPFIEAVEIDGREVFVAGSASPGSLLRVYANDILLGQATASPDGRFLVEAERDLPVGDYIIRADVLGQDGTTVIARAAVPFQRPQGDNIAAVAPDAMARGAAPQESSEATVAETPAPAPAGEGAQQPNPAPAATNMPADPDAAAGQPADSAADQPAPAVSDQAPAQPSGAGQVARADTAAPAASQGTGEPDEAPRVAASDSSAPADPGSPPPPAMTPPPQASSAGQVSRAETGAPAAPPRAEEPAQAVPPAAASGTPATAAPGSPPLATMPPPAPAAPDEASQDTVPEMVAPALQPVDGAVIIRRGDTLWQISRRVYGRGVRYTTIYLANQQQIRDPDRIWPGQIFTVPEKTEEGESADLSAIDGQAVAPGKAAERAQSR